MTTHHPFTAKLSALEAELHELSAIEEDLSDIAEILSLEANLELLTESEEEVEAWIATGAGELEGGKEEKVGQGEEEVEKEEERDEGKLVQAEWDAFKKGWMDE
ncbi:MAG: hypothetical protein M1824_004619 [Vezdaea acicularis]|nr:MAG: hypothetical protein M1824_004619 [Vezdaea acicularis]